VVLASLGGTLEFYDFVIFGVFAKEIAEAVFPNPTPIVSLMISFAAFAAGYLARPVGGIVLGHFGDRYGRRQVFLVSIFVMSAATLGMGLVPSYATWGVAASATLVVLRLLQGFCLGGQLPGALTYVVETAPRQAPFVCGFVFACVTMGVAAASMLSLAVHTFLSPLQVVQYGWRIAFMLGGFGGFLSFLLRRSLEESPEFARMSQLASTRPFREVLRTRAAAVAAGIAALAATSGFNGLFFAHAPAYLAGVLHYDARQAVLAQTAGVIVHALGILAIGRMANRIDPLLLLRVGATLLLALAYPFYLALEARSVDLVLLMILAGLTASLVNGTFAYLLTDLFPTRVRFSGVALVFNISFTAFSGAAPLVATALIRSSGRASAPALVMMASALLTVAGSLAMRRHGGSVPIAFQTAETNR
jgi:MFS transporter, MHS family, proline/betaine transporter